jgi:hypothetical protein
MDLEVSFGCLRWGNRGGMSQKGPAKRLAEESRRLAEKDDLLRGFDETGPTRGQFKAFFATSIGLSLWAWYAFFRYGAYGISGVANFRYAHPFVVVSLVALVGALIVRRQVRLHKWTFVVFTPVVLVVILRLVAPTGPLTFLRPRVITTGAFGVIEAVLVAAGLVSSPLLLWVIARLLAPHYFTLPGRRLKIGVVLIVTAVALTAYLAGRFNYRFLTCEEFDVAGEMRPANCTPAQK